MRRRSVLSAGIGTVMSVYSVSGQPDVTVRLGWIGTGARGTSMLRNALRLPRVQVVALCDIRSDRADHAGSLVTQAGQSRPELYTRGEEDFRRLMERDDLHGVVITTPWEWHTPMAVAAMRTGKYAGTEVPAAVTIADCWELVRTSEETGVPCMLLENFCYHPEVMALLTMVRQGLFGEISHCECGYLHDARYVKFDADGNDLWRVRYARELNGNIYPTHAVGPVAHWLRINAGNRFEYLTSMSSKSRGLNWYLKTRFGPDHPNVNIDYAMGDVNTSLIYCTHGETIVIKYDTQSPRPETKMWMIQGTKGVYQQDRDAVSFDNDTGVHHVWQPMAPYLEQYQHPLWRRYGETARGSGHGGGDYLTLQAFVESIRRKVQTPIDVYDAVAWSSIIPLSIESVRRRSAPVDFPDFTKGRWKSTLPTFGLTDEY